MNICRLFSAFVLFFRRLRIFLRYIRHWVMRKSFEPQSVLYQFPVSQFLVPQLRTRLLSVAPSLIVMRRSTI